jgi:hypothetical protein
MFEFLTVTLKWREPINGLKALKITLSSKQRSGSTIQLEKKLSFFQNEANTGYSIQFS